MNKQKKVLFIQKMLNELFPEPAIPLFHTSAYTLLIAVLLSARAQDATVNQVTPALFALGDTPEKMVALGYVKILSLIKSIGLSPTKAKNILALSKMLLEEHGGEVPSTFTELEALPGVGHKTASVVLIQAFGKAAFPVDTHIYRCARRWGLSRGKTVNEVENDLKKLFQESSWGRLHLQIIYFGRKYCPARGHVIEKCPICSKI